MTQRRISRLFYDGPLVPGSNLLLEGPKQHYVRSVLRCRVGQVVVLFNGDGWDYPCELITLSKRTAELNIGAQTAPPTPPCPGTLHLVQGLCAGSKMDWIIQKATELGVHHVWPVSSDHSQSIKGAGKLAHWQAVADSACEQSGRAQRPTIHALQSLSTLLATSQPDTTDIVLDLDDAPSPPLQPTPHRPHRILVGPEGGWSSAEKARFHELGMTRFCLNTATLRAETAAIAALSLMAYWQQQPNGSAVSFLDAQP